MATVKVYKGTDDPTFLVVFEEQDMVREMSTNACSPGGVNMHCGSPSEWFLDEDDTISLTMLPTTMLKAIIQAL